MQYSIETIKSKKGQTYECLKIKIGEYEKLLFPTKIEMIYLKHLIEKEAHADFQGEK